MSKVTITLSEHDARWLQAKARYEELHNSGYGYSCLSVERYIWARLRNQLDKAINP